jgi:hypothetical protein
VSGGYKNRDFTEAEERQDYANEQAIAKQLAVSWQCEMEKQPKFATFDYIAKRDKAILAFVEVRKRSHKINAFPDVYINLKKLLEARLLESATDTKCLFVVQFVDCLAYCRLNKKLQLIKSTGGWKRRNPNDVEEVALIPISQFQKIHCVGPRSLSQANQR